MPYIKIEDVPANIRKHKEVDLTVEQANEWSAIFDAIKDNPSLDDPAAVAWTTWENVYKIDGDKWAKKERQATEGLSIDYYVGTILHEAIEQGSDGLPREATIVVIKAGPTQSKGRYYDPEALKEMVESGMLSNLKQYDMHVPNAESKPGAIFKNRSIGDLWSYFVESWWDPTTQEVKAKVKLCDRTIKEKLRDAWQHLGVSITALGETYIGKDGLEHVKKISKVVSADWVTEANAGGRVLQIAEALAPGQNNGKGGGSMMPEWKELTVAMLMAQRPDLYEQLISQGKEAAKNIATDEAVKVKSEADKKVDDANKATETAKAEANELKVKLQEKEKFIAESAEKNKVAEMKTKFYELAEEKTKDLTPLAKMKVINELAGKTFNDDKALSEAIDASIELVKKQPATVLPVAKPSDKPSLAEKSKAFAEALGISEEEQAKLAEID